MEQKLNNFTEDESNFLKDFTDQTLIGELAQAEDLKQNCNSAFQYAQTHSAYIKDWENTKAKMQENLRTNNFHSDFSPTVYQEMINISNQIVEKKLEKVRSDFHEKFGETIYNYLGTDGKAKGCFGAVLLFFTTTGLLSLLI